jgi:hypothetical protein
LQIRFIAETPFPIKKGRNTSIEDEVISLLPDSPSCYNVEFHEEIMSRLAFGLFHHGMEGKIKVPVDS